MPINPKAALETSCTVSYPSTREWKEGLMSVNFRDMSNNKTAHQWIVLDGDIDAEWIESMNTVMDDNKMLTLASNERIPLTGTMRLLLEINHAAAPLHGVPRRRHLPQPGHRVAAHGGIVDQGLEAKDRQPLIENFDRYMEKSLEHCRRNFRTIVPLVPMNIAGTVCKIRGLIPAEHVERLRQTGK